MIETVKVKKQFRLDELIKYVRDNGVNSQAFVSDGGRASVYFDSEQNISLGEYTYGELDIERTFTVEVEEMITEDTTFERLVTLGCRGTINIHDDKSLSDLSGKKEYGAQVFALINGKLELIWEAE